MTATFAPETRTRETHRRLMPTLTTILALVAIVIAVIALATTPSHTVKVITTPAPAVATQSAPGAQTAVTPSAATAGVSSDTEIDCRQRRVGTMC